MNNMESMESIVAQVERFEDYCLRKRCLEGDIESVLARRDENAVEAVEHAESELENTKRECAEIGARVERARQGDFDRVEIFRSPSENRLQAHPNVQKEGGAPQTSGRNTPFANAASNESIQPQAVIEPSYSTPPSVISSITASTADSDGFSVVSHLPQGAASKGITQESSPSPSGHLEDNSSNKFLTILVQRYIDICHERRTLQEEIEYGLDRKERVAAERLRCARIILETTRQEAVDIVAALNEASGGDTKINPSAGIVGSINSKSISSVADSAYVSGSGPTGTPPTVPRVPVLDPVKAREPATPTPPLKETRLPPSTIVSAELDAIRSEGVEHLSPSTVRHIPAPGLPTPTPLPTLAPLPRLPITATHQAIFMKYDQLMIEAKAAGSALSMQRVPWPLFTPSVNQYPQQHIVAVQLVGSSMTGFVEEYARWKGWNLKGEWKSVLADWEQLHSQVPERKPGGKACMQRVVSILRTFMRS